MGQWVEENAEVLANLAVIGLLLVVVGVQAWRYRGDRRTTSSTNDMLVGYAVGFAVILPVQVLRVTTVGAPESASASLAWSVGSTMALFAIALAVAHLRNRRQVARDDEEVRSARDAIPAAARSYFRDGDFPVRAGFALSSPAAPDPDHATDLVGYWAFAALDSGDYVDFSRTIHYTTMVRGWQLSSPTLIEALPVLVAPFVRSGDKEWDPDVDRAFRRTALALLTTRFGSPVPA
ncbi:hypothetical protein GCM10009551_084600 [Nocardiopsis tropica]|uniref:hypothetical protein n=1 Tax=Tsukamurella TaxID=2060 RepID=UPI001C7CE5E9|nr:hypothetical protein [Tsukamurella sp. TY48]GIZ98614.1 hypothetical protein TTY48_32260 [Tsukamurella sp. TY48]